MNVFSPKLFGAALAALVLTQAPAEARNGRNAAVLGGLAVGAAGAAILLNGARAAPAVEEEVEVEPAEPRYVPVCRMERRRVWIDAESYTYKRVEVCE